MHCGADGEEETEDQLDQLNMMTADTFPVSKESSADLAEDRPPHVYSTSRRHRRRLVLAAEDYGSTEEDFCGRTPPPVNSLVDSCPLDGSFNQEALLKKFSRMGGTESQVRGQTLR